MTRRLTYWDARDVLDALTNAAQHCPYHGQDFTRAGTVGMDDTPRCDSCKQPFRVVRALAVMRAVDDAAERAAEELCRS